MAKLLPIFFLCLLGHTLVAQYVPNSNQAFQFAPVFNPAFSGLEGYRDLKFSYRYQWAGFGGDAPKFINLSYNFRIKEPLDLTLHSLRTTSTTTNRKKDDIPKIKKAIQGLGLSIFNETVGPINRLGGGVNYAFHYPINNNLRLSGGLGVMLDNTKINLDKLYLGINAAPDPFYDRLVANGSNHTELNVRAGVLLYSPKFYVGLSYLPIVNTSIKTSEVNIGDPFYKASIQAGVAFPVSPTIDIKPSILALWQLSNTISVDYNVKMFVQEKIWFGVTYRDIESFVGILGFNLNDMLGASYSYEVSSSGIQQFSDGSHELVLSVRLNNFKRLSQQTW
jgi:type IX secretion system PorP/SprF family membrane protein